MARIKIELPSSYAFTTEIPLRITDINYGGHLGNDAVLGLVHEARLQFLKSLGLTELDIGGASLIMADAAIVYKAEGFYGDTVQIQVAVGELSRTGFDLFYLLENLNTGMELARAKTGMVTFDYTARKVVAVPDGFRARFASTSVA